MKPHIETNVLGIKFCKPDRQNALLVHRVISSGHLGWDGYLNSELFRTGFNLFSFQSISYKNRYFIVSKQKALISQPTWNRPTVYPLWATNWDNLL